jgi:hypothetical protein
MDLDRSAEPRALFAVLCLAAAVQGCVPGGGGMSSEALALRLLAAAIERRESLLKFLDDEHAPGQLGGTSGLSVSCFWASSCTGHKELMTALTQCVRDRVPELLAEVRARANDEVAELRVQLPPPPAKEPQ